MFENRNVVVVSAVRTAIGTYGGSLAGTPPTELAATCVRAAVEMAGVEPADVGHVAFGNVIHTEPRDMYLSRVAAVNGDTMMYAASIPKLAILLGAFVESREENMSLDQETPHSWSYSATPTARLRAEPSA